MARRQIHDQSIRPPGSRLLYAIDRAASRPAVAWVLVTADVAWVEVSSRVGFPTRLETIFQTLVAALTLAMVFVIQHTQTREQLVTQRKLDELLAAVPRADTSLIALEEASDYGLAQVHADHLAVRETASADPRERWSAPFRLDPQRFDCRCAMDRGRTRRIAGLCGVKSPRSPTTPSSREQRPRFSCRLGWRCWPLTRPRRAPSAAVARPVGAPVPG